MERPKTPPTFVVASHEALFEPSTDPHVRSDAPALEERCDACGDVVPRNVDDDGFAVSGRGRFLWTRGEERRAEEPPLCPSCAAAIGMTALQQWNIEEDEG
jgi:hypothetical protein